MQMEMIMAVMKRKRKTKEIRLNCFLVSLLVTFVLLVFPILVLVDEKATTDRAKHICFTLKYNIHFHGLFLR